MCSPADFCGAKVIWLPVRTFQLHVFWSDRYPPMTLRVQKVYALPGLGEAICECAAALELVTVT